MHLSCSEYMRKKHLQCRFLWGKGVSAAKPLPQLPSEQELLAGAVSNSSRFPDKLDITLRTDTGSVLSSITPASGTCILKLSLAAHSSPQEQRSQRSRLLDLLHGLSSKSKTGVVERLPLPDGTLCQLYLIPPSSSVAQRLGVEWSKDECLFGMLALQRQH